MARIIKVGIVGVGRAGVGMHAPEILAYPDCFEMVAAADHAPDRLRNLPPAFAKLRLHSSFESLLADSEVELVSLAVRHREHTPFAIQALDAGKSVFVEKPDEILNRAARK